MHQADGCGRAGAPHRFRVVGIEQQQVAGADGGEMLPARVQQEATTVSGNTGAEVIGHGLVPVELDGEP